MRSRLQREMNAILCENLQPADKTLTIENNGLDGSGNPGFLAYLIDMPRIARFAGALDAQGRNGTIICFDFQKEILSKYCGERVSFETIDFEKFEGVFVQFGRRIG